MSFLASTSSEIYLKLNAAVEQSALTVIGHQDLYDIAEIQVLTAIVQTFGDEATGFVYSEPSLLDARIPPPDIVLVHPSLGVVVIECKAYDLSYIRGAEAGSLKITRYGKESLVNPLKQARRGMFAIKDAYERFAASGPRPLFHALVALPNISRHEWHQLGYHRVMDSRFVLFQEQFQQLDMLYQRIENLVQQTKEKVGGAAPIPADAMAILRRVFGDSAVINHARLDLQALKPEGLGAEIIAIEKQHKQLSPQQEQLSRMNVWGHPFLVRGVAGSGKSIVLANQVARVLYHIERQRLQPTLFAELESPIPRVGVVCFNRALVPLLRNRIAVAYENLTGHRDLPDHLVVTDLNRLLYSIAQQTDHFRYITGGRAGRTAQRAQRHYAQLETMRSAYPKHFDPFCFDALFVDEGQDANPDEYNILRLLTRAHPDTNERSVGIFYDDAQNLYGNPAPTWRELGLNVSGGRAFFMTEAYRNSREILEVGVNVLLGTHARQGVRVATRRFMDVYTLQEKGLLEESEAGWKVNFAQEAGVTPIIKGFPSRYEQLDWVAEAAATLLDEEGVLPEHILILAPRATTFRHLSQRIVQLASRAPKIHMVGGNFQQGLDDLLIQAEHLTLSTIHAAKGYDAPIVFLTDVDMIPNTVIGRAQFYVGVTRAKRYLLLTGLDLPNTLMREAIQYQS